MTERFPLDFETLKKGDYIEPAMIERICGFKSHTAAYQFGLLKLQADIQDHCEGFVVKQEKLGLRILKDLEASEYLGDMNRRRYRAIGRSNVLLGKVDQEVLTDAQRREHERRLIVHSRMLQAALAERKLALGEIGKKSLPNG